MGILSVLKEKKHRTINWGIESAISENLWVVD